MNRDDRSSSIRQRRALRYGLAFVAVVAGFGLRAALTAWIGPGLPTYITFYPAVMVAALLAGFGPGVLATVLTGFTAAYWILPPDGFAITSPVARVGLVLFTGLGLFMSAVAELYRRDRRKAEAYDQEQALRETRREKEFLSDVLERAAHPFAVGYPDGRIGLCNRAYEQLTGYSVEELRAIDWSTTLTPPEWREPEQQKLEELRRSGQPVRYEKEYVRKDGTRVPIELLVHMVKDAGGKSEYYFSFLTDITERRRAQTALRESADRLGFALETSHTGAWDLNLVDHTTCRSLEHDRIFGYADLLPEWTYEMFLEHVLPEDRPAVDGKFRRAMQSQGDWSFECRIRRTDGEVRWIWAAGRHRLDAAGAPRRMAGIVQDITELKQKETELHRLNRMLDALRHSNEAMMHADREEDCLAETCKIVTVDCGYTMVWIGYAGADEHQTIRPVAHAGFDAGYLGTLRLTWADTERGRGPTGTAIRTGQPCGCRNMLTDPRFAPWREEAIKRGYASSLAVPLRAKGRVFGAITIYSRQPDSFSEDEVKLLAELADDLAYGITALQLRKAHAQAEQALRQSEERNREELERRVVERTAELHGAFHYARGLIETTLDPLVTISPEGRITDVNKATELATGVSREQLIGSNFSNYFTEPAKADAGYQKVLADGLVRDYPLSLRHVSGHITEVLYNATVFQDEAGRVQGVFAAARDITERVAAEKRRAITQSLLELFAHKASGKEYFDAVVEVIRGWIGCQCLGIRVLDEQGNIPYAAAVGFDAEFLRLEGHLSVKSDNCFCIRTISQCVDEQDRPLLTPAGSLRCDNTPGFMRRLAPENRCRYRGTCVKWGFASLAVIPIRYRDRVLGAIHLADRRPDCFSPAAVEFLESMTPLIGEAIQRFHAEAELSRHRDHLEELVKQRTAELETANRHLQQAEASLQRERDQLEVRVQERTADLSAANRALQAEMVQRQRAEKEHKNLLRRLADAQESERARISRELHDQLGQELTALKLGLRLVKNQGASIPAIGQSAGKLEQLAGGLMQAVHRLAWELHPAVLDDLGLEAALRRYTADWSENNRLPVDFHCDGMETGRLPLELEMALYRVTQEALTNILRHASAKRVSVLLERRPDLVSLIVEDDGAGFDAAMVFQAARSRGKLGLLGMQERITLTGGTIEIESTPGAGTTIFARIPWASGRPTES